MIVCVFCYTVDKPLPGKPVAPPVELFQTGVNHYIPSLPPHLDLHWFTRPYSRVCSVERVNEGLTTASEPSCVKLRHLNEYSSSVRYLQCNLVSQVLLSRA